MFSWDDFMNDFPYTNFSDINVSWFLNKFKQIFDEWQGLYSSLQDWKTATDEYNETWRQEQEQAFTTWENNFQSAIDAWKARTEIDINTWETETITSLETWKTAFIAQYNALKAEVEQIAEDAENAKNSAQASAQSAQQSADNASATALALQASLGQIDTNTADISELKTQFDEVTIKDPVYTPVETYTLTDGEYIGIAGGIVSANSFEYASFPVNPGEVYHVSAWAGQSARLWVIKDSNNVVIAYHDYSGSQSQQEDTVIVPSNGTVFIVNNNNSHDFHIDSVTYNVYINGEKVKLNNETLYNIIDALISALNTKADTSDLEPLNNSLSYAEITSDANPEDIIITNNYYMFTSGGTSKSDLWRYMTYEIPSDATKLIVSAYAGQSARLWILKNANNQIIGYSDDSSTASIKTETVDLSLYTGATILIINDRKSENAYIKYTHDTESIDSYKLPYNSENVGDALDNLYNNVNKIHDSNTLYGKILCCCGDSITYGADMDAEGITDESNIDVYQSDAIGDFTKTTSGFRKTWNWQIASKNNMTLYNAGVSGSTMQGEGGVNGFSLANGRYTKLPDNIDYLLIWFGWNDNAYGTLGTIDDVTNASYYGGYNVVLPYLLNKYPYAKIGLIVPFGSSASHREAIRQLGNKWGIAVWDNYYGGTPLYYGKEDSVGVEPSIVTANKAKFQANGAHPNFKGHRQLADMIEHWLMGI